MHCIQIYHVNYMYYMQIYHMEICTYIYVQKCVSGHLFWSAIHEPWFMPLAVFCTTSTHSLIFKRAVI